MTDKLARRHGKVRRRRRLHSGRGQSLAEFALIAPVFFLVVFGIVDFSRMVQSYVTMQHSAREGARYAVTGRGDCAASTPNRANCIDYVTRRSADNLANSSGTTVTVRSWPFASGGLSATPQAGPGQQCDGVEVKVDYDYHPMTPIISFFVPTVHLHAGERLVNEPYGPCG